MAGLKIEQIFEKMVAFGASDLFLRINAAPHARVNGKIQVIENQIISREGMWAVKDFLLDDEMKREYYAKNFDIDFIYVQPGVGRFRINLFTQRGTPALVARYVTDKVSTFEELNLPKDLCKQFCHEARGLVLVCGPAGSGKSTSIASMVDYINSNKEKHVVTIEDPIEFLFKDKKSIINQRELGLDVASYPMALKHVTQQSPDIIYIGTIRDTDTMKAAISAAELGVLVMSTFHTINSIQTIERIVNFFPPHLHGEVRMQLSLLLKGVLSLRLLSRKDGQGRIPAYEAMVVTPTIARLVREGNITQIQSFIDEGELFGMRSFKQSLVKLVQDGLVAEEDARNVADSKDEFDLELRGIKRLSR